MYWSLSKYRHFKNTKLLRYTSCPRLTTRTIWVVANNQNKHWWTEHRCSYSNEQKCTKCLPVMCMLSCFSSVWFFATLWTVARRLLHPWGFSRQEYWSGLPGPPPGDLPNPGIEPWSSALLEDSLPAEPPGKLDFSIRNRTFAFKKNLDIDTNTVEEIKIAMLSQY